jgi:hypothetical protein
MPASAQSALLRWRGRPLDGEGREGPPQGELVRPGQVREIHRVEPAERGVRVTDDLEVAADVGARKTELTGGRGQVFDRPGRADLEDDVVVLGTRRRTVVGPETDVPIGGHDQGEGVCELHLPPTTF